jgi:hypothetical protein
MTYVEIKEKFERFEDHNVIMHLQNVGKRIYNWRNHGAGNPDDLRPILHTPYIEVLNVVTYQIEYHNVSEIISIDLYVR